MVLRARHKGTEVYGVIVAAKPAPPQSMAPRQSIVPRQSIGPSTSVVQQSPDHHPPKFSVFRPPSSNDSEVSKHPATSGSSDEVTTPIPFSFTPNLPTKVKSLSVDTQSKTKPKPTFSAAFAPPVSRPSPKKAATSALSSPIKRPRSAIDDDAENRDMDKPSPPKRQASAASKRSSGYYAKRKSLAVAMQPPSSSTTTATVAPVFPKEKPGIGLGLASLGSGPSNAWARFNKDIGQADEPPTSKEVETEAAQQASASPSLTIISPAPSIGTPPNDSNSTPILQVPSVESDELVIERAQSAGPQEIEEPSGTTMGVDIDATEQWRESVQQDDQYEEDAI